MSELSPAQFVLAVAVAAALSMGVFWHASKRGSRHPTAWGVAVFLFAGIAIPAYAINVLLANRRR